MPQGVLVVLNGHLTGRELAIQAPVATIGRNPENQLQIADRNVSRFHAEIQVRTDGHWLRDLQSSLGTQVNGARITEHRLQHGDEIVIGETRLQFLVEGMPRPRGRRQQAWISFDLPEQSQRSLAERLLEGRPPALDARGELDELSRRYEILYRSMTLINSAAAPDEVYDEILRQLFEVVPADRGIILIKDPKAGELRLIASRTRDLAKPSHVRVSRTIINRAMEQRIAILTRDAQSDPQFEGRESIVSQSIRSAICTPLLHRGETMGIIYLDNLTPDHPFDENELGLVTAIAGAAAVAIQNAIHSEEMRSKSEEIQRSYLATINVVSNSIEARDKYTIGHGYRVMRFAMALAEELGWDERRREILEMGGVLHDVGKVGIKDAILCKEGKLTDEEFRVMKLHPEIGARILRDVPFLRPAIPYVLCHHERWGGGGYPASLKGADIPVEGRILAIADAFDAMTSNRVYRRSMSPEDAIGQVEKCSGTQFDPELAALFIDLYRGGKVSHILQNKALEESRYVLCPVCTTYVRVEQEVNPGDPLTCPVCQKGIGLVGDLQLVTEPVKV